MMMELIKIACSAHMNVLIAQVKAKTAVNVEGQIE